MSYTALAHLPVPHGVPNFMMGCLNSREYGNPGVPIFTGCVIFLMTLAEKMHAVERSRNTKRSYWSILARSCWFWRHAVLGRVMSLAALFGSAVVLTLVNISCSKTLRC